MATERRFVRERYFDENLPDLNADSLRQLMQEKLGVKRVIILENTEEVGIQHIDCLLKVLDPERLLVKRAPAGHPETDALERNVAVLATLKNAFGRPYEILRIDCPEVERISTRRETTALAAYTNSLIFNNRVFVPLFNIPGDAQAIETWKAALPGHEVMGFPSDQWLDFDALHCRTRAFFDPNMIRIEHPRIVGDVHWSAIGYTVTAIIEDMSKTGLDLNGCQVFYRSESESDWKKTPFALTKTVNQFVAQLPPFPPDTTVQYYLRARNVAGKSVNDPLSAPNSFFKFRVGQQKVQRED